MKYNTENDPRAWLSRFPALRDIKDEAWTAAVNVAKLMTIPPDTTIIRKGDPCPNFLLAIDGTVRVFQRAESGREITLFRTGAGEMCISTLKSLIDETHYNVDEVTEGEVCVASIPQEYFHRALAQSDGFRRYVLSTVTHRLCDVIRLTQQVAFESLDLRLACLLGDRLKESGASLEITHQLLAHELGTSREVVSRMLEEFENRGIIRLRRNRIELLSPEGLEQRCGRFNGKRAVCAGTSILGKVI